MINVDLLMVNVLLVKHIGILKILVTKNAFLKIAMEIHVKMLMVNVKHA